jgi:hypothetical protein
MTHSTQLRKTIDAAAIIDRAADLIEKYGWRKGAYGNTATGFCIEGAMIAASSITGERYEMTKYGVIVPRATDDAFIAFSKFVGVSRPAVYNDHSGRTKEAVLASLRACAAIYRAKRGKPVPPVLHTTDSVDDFTRYLKSIACPARMRLPLGYPLPVLDAREEVPA